MTEHHTLADRLRARSDQLGLAPAHVAEMAGVNRSFVYDILRGRSSRPSIDRLIEQIQWQTVIPMFCERIWGWFIEYAQDAGLLPRGVEIFAEWGPTRFESVNPLQDAQADLLEVRSGFATIPQQIARRGYDPDELLKEAADFNAKMDGLGLVYDADPRKVTKAGLVQTADPNAAPSREPATE